MSITQENNLPTALVEYIDGIEGPTISGIADAGTVDFHLTYGSLEEEDRYLEMLDLELGTSATVYVNDLEMFLSTSPDYGIPAFVWGSYDTRPQHQPSGWGLDGWLKVAKKHLPGAEGEVMDEIVACIDDSFNAESFAHAVPALAEGKRGYEIDSAQRKLDGRAHELVSDTISQLMEYATSADTIRVFLGSEFFQTFGDQVYKAVLQLRIRELQGEAATATYAEQALEVSRAIITTNPHHTGRYLGSIIRQDPEVASRIIAESSDEVASNMRSYGRIALQLIDADERTEVQNSVLATLETQDSQELSEFAPYIKDHLKRTGSYKPEHVAAVKAMVENVKTTSKWAYNILFASEPIDEVAALLEKHPRSLREPSTAAICVRRFASEGRTEKAYEIARRPDVSDSHRDLLESLRNLLAIYDETGDESAYIEAEQRLTEARTGTHYFMVEHEAHELLARTFVAAHKHGHTERAEQAQKQMEPYYSLEFDSDRNKCIERMLRISLDEKDLAGAERFAVMLYESKQRTASEYDQDNRFDGLLHVIRAQVQAGDLASATSLVQTYFATEDPPWQIATAIRLLNGEKPGYMPSLFASHLNAITELKDLRG